MQKTCCSFAKCSASLCHHGGTPAAKTNIEETMTKGQETPMQEQTLFSSKRLVSATMIARAPKYFLEMNFEEEQNSPWV